MSILSNVVTVSSSGSIPNNQRVTLVGASSLTLTLPINDGTTLSANTRFIVVIPTGLGITGTILNTSDGTLFFENGLTSYPITTEGQFEICINNSQWYVLKYTVASGGGGGTPGGLSSEVQWNDSGSFNGTSATIATATTLQVKDTSFAVVNSTDITKLLQWDLSGITTATIRTITMVNFSGTQVLSNGALTSTRIPFSGTAGLQDNAFFAWDNVNNQLELTNGGSNTLPALMFGASMGFYQVSASNLGLAISGVLRHQFDVNSARSGITGGYQCGVSPGSAIAPVYSFTNDTNTGIWSISSDTLNFSTGGTDRLTIDTAGVYGSVSGSYLMRTAAGAAATPTYSFRNDTDTGFWSNAANTIKWSTSGTQKGTVDSSGRMFVGGATAPTAFLHLAAGTAAANTAPFKTTSGVLNTTAEAGAWEHTDPYIYFTNSFLVRNKITQSQTFLTGSPFTKTADTTLATVTGLSASVVTNNNYRFEARIHIDADAVGGFELGFGGTATLSSITAELMYFDNSGLNNFSRRITTFPGGFGGHVGSTEGFMMIQGYFRAATTGTFTIEFAQDIAAGSSSVQARSTFEVYQG